MTSLVHTIRRRFSSADPGRVTLRSRRWGLRRLASAGLTAGALAASLHVLAPGPPQGQPVLLAEHDLAAGSVLHAGDLRSASRPADDLPSGVLGSSSLAVGRVLTSGVRAGEVLTDARVVGPGLVAGLPVGTVAVPVRIADGQAASLVAPGDRVDVLVSTDAGDAEAVARSAIVLAQPSHGSTGGLLGSSMSSESGGGLLVLAVTAEEARPLAAAASRGPLSLTLRSG